jgi:hypothetical protein
MKLANAATDEAWKRLVDARDELDRSEQIAARGVPQSTWSVLSRYCDAKQSFIKLAQTNYTPASLAAICRTMRALGINPTNENALDDVVTFCLEGPDGLELQQRCRASARNFKPKWQSASDRKTQLNHLT